MNTSYIEAILGDYGEPVTIRRGQDEPVRSLALIQPLTYKNKVFLDGAYTEIGYADRSRYTYIGKAEQPFCELYEDVFIDAEHTTFLVVKSHTVRVGGVPLYVQAVLEEVHPETEESV